MYFCLRNPNLQKNVGVPILIFKFTPTHAPGVTLDRLMKNIEHVFFFDVNYSRYSAVPELFTHPVYNIPR